MITKHMSAILIAIPILLGTQTVHGAGGDDNYSSSAQSQMVIMKQCHLSRLKNTKMRSRHFNLLKNQRKMMPMCKICLDLFTEKLANLMWPVSITNVRWKSIQNIKVHLNIRVSYSCCTAIKKPLKLIWQSSIKYAGWGVTSMMTSKKR